MTYSLSTLDCQKQEAEARRYCQAVQLCTKVGVSPDLISGRIEEGRRLAPKPLHRSPF
jgi:hypothetical protein